MKRTIAGLGSGLVFGIGLHLSGMSNPTKVLNFLDLFGEWDPSLILVMVAALIITGIGYRIIWRRGQPLLGDNFHEPSSKKINSSLLAGAAIFGLGWGLVGICPGPALSTLFLGYWQISLFTAAMAVGMWLTAKLQRRNLAIPE